MQYKILGLLLVLFGIIVWSCSSDKNPMPSKSHPITWNQVGNANFHGAKVLTSGLESCTSCHGADYNGGDSKASCFKCHDSYPHNRGWIENSSEENHGSYILSNQDALNNCSRCHGMDYLGGNTDVSCFSCHATYPHLSTWAGPANEAYHGTYLKSAGWSLDSCIVCHGDDFKGGESGSSCYACHTTYPHAETWTNSSDEGHGAYVLANIDSMEACADCHGADFGGGTSEVSCYTCHQSYPHFPNWSNASSEQFHGIYLKNLDYNIEPCQSCHGQNYSGGNANVSCFTCHESFPHSQQDAWYSPAGHGAWVIERSWDIESCADCHGSDYQGGTSETACYDCHSSFPHTQDWMSISSEGSHAAYVKARNWSTRSCQSCHGNDYTGGPSQVSCYTCHQSYPHVGDWDEGEGEESHAEFVANHSWDIESCADCHGEDYLGGSSEVSCYSCHPSYPHVEDWKSGSDQSHNKYIKTLYWSLESCQSCHGEDYSGGRSDASCNTCHTGEQGPESCNVCHGSDLNNAPPQDLNDGSDTSTWGVGSHQIHLDVFPSCTLCHPYPENFNDPSHLDGSLPAEVNPDLLWDRETSTCGNVYCHGDENKVYKWN